MGHIVAQMDSQIEGAISENEHLLRVNDMLRTALYDFLSWFPEKSSPPEWQPIETAPKDGTEILAWSADEGRYVTAWETFTDGYGDQYIDWIHPDCGELGPNTACPTHWQSLPAPPTLK